MVSFALSSSSDEEERRYLTNVSSSESCETKKAWLIEQVQSIELPKKERKQTNKQPCCTHFKCIPSSPRELEILTRFTYCTTLMTAISKRFHLFSLWTARQIYIVAFSFDCSRIQMHPVLFKYLANDVTITHRDFCLVCLQTIKWRSSQF